MKKKKAAKKRFRLCNCPFDCLEDSGLDFHDIVLSELDLAHLPNRQPQTIRKALQHKCYSLLTGEDLELFPDLQHRLAILATSTRVPTPSEGQRAAVDTRRTDQIMPVKPSSGMFWLFEGMMLPSILFLSFSIAVFVVLSHKLFFQQHHRQEHRVQLPCVDDGTRRNANSVSPDDSTTGSVCVQTLSPVPSPQGPTPRSRHASSPDIVINIPTVSKSVKLIDPSLAVAAAAAAATSTTSLEWQTEDEEGKNDFRGGTLKSIRKCQCMEQLVYEDKYL